MRTFNNFNLLTKIMIPLTMTALVAAGLVLYARHALTTIADRTQEIVRVQTARQNHVLNLQVGVTEATIQNRNIVIAKVQPAMNGFKTREAAAIVSSRAALANLAALADTPQRKATNDELRTAMDAYLAVLARTTDLAMKGESEAATRVAQEEAAPLRAKLRDQIGQRIAAIEQELKASAEQAEATAGYASITLVVASVVGLLAALGVAVLIAILAIARPIRGMTASMSRLADGDLSIEVAGLDRKDELGLLARALAIFRDNAVAAQAMAAEQAAENQAKMRRAEVLDGLTQRFEANVSALTQGLAGAATEMEATAQSMSATADQAIRQSTTVASAAEETSTNVHTVAAASEEMSASIQEIVTQVSRSSEMAHQAVADTRRTEVTAKRLTEVAGSITEVVAMISTIAGQTNLLALNATIEAARAGEAGRGFAVVATEVKELAGQTARATEDIRTKIDEIQGATSEVVSDIARIGRTIVDMSNAASGVAAAMEEQGAATREIARNVQEAAQGTQEVTVNIEQVRTGAAATGTAAVHVLGAAKELSRHSEDLSQEVSQFLAGVKAA